VGISPPDDECKTGLPVVIEPGWAVISELPDKTVQHQPLWYCLPLRDLAQVVTLPHATDKGLLPFIKAAIFGDTRSPVYYDKSGVPRGGSFRHDGNVIAVYGAEGDHDTGSITAEQAAELLHARRIRGLIYKTPSDAPGKPRWRVLVFYARPVIGDTATLRAARARAVSQLNAILNNELARESWALSQSFYIGNVEGRPRVETFLCDGADYLCIDEYPDLPEKSKRPPPEKSIRVARGSAPMSQEQFESMTDAIVAGLEGGRLEGGYEALYPLIMSTARTAVQDDDDGSVRLAQATRIRDAVPGSQMDDARLRTAFNAAPHPDGVTAGTFYGAAQRAGWKDPSRIASIAITWRPQSPFHTGRAQL